MRHFSLGWSIKKERKKHRPGWPSIPEVIIVLSCHSLSLSLSSGGWWDYSAVVLRCHCSLGSTPRLSQRWVLHPLNGWMNHWWRCYEGGADLRPFRRSEMEQGFFSESGVDVWSDASARVRALEKALKHVLKFYILMVIKELDRCKKTSKEHWSYMNCYIFVGSNPAENPTTFNATMQQSRCQYQSPHSKSLNPSIMMAFLGFGSKLRCGSH